MFNQFWKNWVLIFQLIFNVIAVPVSWHTGAKEALPKNVMFFTIKLCLFLSVNRKLWVSEWVKGWRDDHCATVFMVGLIFYVGEKLFATINLCLIKFIVTWLVPWYHGTLKVCYIFLYHGIERYNRLSMFKPKWDQLAIFFWNHQFELPKNE